MIDWNKVSGFDWDDGNSIKSQEKHNASRFEAEQLFFNEPLVVAEDIKHSQNEVRYLALGKTGSGRLLHIAFSLRDDDSLIRVISALDMHREE